MEVIISPVEDDLYSINAGALLALGLGLLGQTIISAYCLFFGQHLIPSWSSYPLNTALVTLHLGAHHQPGRSMLSVQEFWEPDSINPRLHQICAARAKLSNRWVLVFAWSVVLVAVLWLLSTWLISQRIPSFTDSYGF